jgi:hypothetical protein
VPQRNRDVGYTGRCDRARRRHRRRHRRVLRRDGGGRQIPKIEDKKWGRGVPSDRSAAMAARAQTMETVADALKRGDITAREAELSLTHPEVAIKTRERKSDITFASI